MSQRNQEKYPAEKYYRSFPWTGWSPGNWDPVEHLDDVQASKGPLEQLDDELHTSREPLEHLDDELHGSKGPLKHLDDELHGRGEPLGHSGGLRDSTAPLEHSGGLRDGEEVLGRLDGLGLGSAAQTAII